MTKDNFVLSEKIEGQLKTIGKSVPIDDIKELKLNQSILPIPSNQFNHTIQSNQNSNFGENGEKGEKESIRRLKEKFSFDEQIEIIDKLSGDELIK